MLYVFLDLERGFLELINYYINEVLRQLMEPHDPVVPVIVSLPTEDGYVV